MARLGERPQSLALAAVLFALNPQTGEVLFTMDQVRDIVRRAVDEKERSLREQYDKILQQKLQEQYQAFAKFNEDYISRSLKANDLGSAFSQFKNLIYTTIYLRNLDYT